MQMGIENMSMLKLKKIKLFGILIILLSWPFLLFWQARIPKPSKNLLCKFYMTNTVSHSASFNVDFFLADVTLLAVAGIA